MLVYAPSYDFGIWGIEKLHPFDSHKFSKAFSLLRKRLGAELERVCKSPVSAITDDELQLVHDASYLASLKSSEVVATALELAPLKWLPSALVDRGLLQPMRWATAGTSLAVHSVLTGESPIAMNLGGGFHHAFRDHGEGFCIYADVAIALAVERARGVLSPEDTVAVIDLDAHRGNGFWGICGAERGVHVLDYFNAQVYPGMFPGDLEDYPFQIPMRAGTSDVHYLNTIRQDVPQFLDSLPRPKLAVYNAGTDILAGDKLGQLSVSFDGVVQRDRFIVEALLQRGIPTAIVTSGGYTGQSYKLVAELAQHVVEQARRA